MFENTTTPVTTVQTDILIKNFYSTKVTVDVKIFLLVCSVFII